jgi:hypothetical protein
VTSIWTEAFTDNQLTSLFLPDSVTIIWDNAFQYNYLETIIFSKSMDTIPNWAFNGGNLTQITIPSWITTIWDEAFTFHNLTPENITIKCPYPVSMWVNIFNNNWGSNIPNPASCTP